MTKRQPNKQMGTLLGTVVRMTKGQVILHWVCSDDSNNLGMDDKT